MCLRLHPYSAQSLQSDACMVLRTSQLHNSPEVIAEAAAQVSSELPLWTWCRGDVTMVEEACVRRPCPSSAGLPRALLLCVDSGHVFTTQSFSQLFISARALAGNWQS